MSEERKNPVIAMVQAGDLILLVSGRQIPVPVGDMIYAAELAEAINKLAVPDEDDE